MKNYFLFLSCSLLLLLSCGKDNDDKVLPEDISNIDFTIGVTFGVVDLQCATNCITVYKWTDRGVFSSDTTAASVESPNNFTFFDCPITEQTVFVSQVNGIRNLPRGIRDVPSQDLSDTIANNENFTKVYTLEYTLKSGATKTIQFFNDENQDPQVGEYYGYIINTIAALNSLDTTPISMCILP